MNRYVVEGIQRDLAKGLTVIVLAHTMVGARAAFNAVAEAMKDDAETIRRANGAERIVSRDGGEFRAISRQSTGLRGVTADVLVIAEHRAYSYEQLQRVLENVAPVAAARPNFEVIPA